ncbi:MAG TPA: sel1 repeat family protein [Rhodanobacteraceae bacterium]|nr:sel1 repeat family protein [Rhodanobacteraceae bacterium]
MALRTFLTATCALLACCATAVTSQRAHAGSTDAVFISSGQSTATTETAPYDSEYAAAQRDMGNGMNTPEADARPGEYYFLLAVHAFRKNDFAFAIQMYEVAAAWAYKPAEYNLAIMYARGQGVPVDLPRGMAWMALAAERNEKRYVDAREAVYAEMTPEQFQQANVIWRELKKTYGDEVALRRAKARWAQVKSSMTGSRVGSVGNMTVGIPNANGGDASFPKPANEAMKKALQSLGMTMAQSTATSPAEATGGEGIDSSIAYRQFRESDNPYDPKFKAGAIGRATVGDPTTLKEKPPADAPSTDQPDTGKQEH